MKRNRRTTIRSRIVAPLLLMSLLQTLLMIGLLISGGVFRQLRENALSILDERTQNKLQSLQAEMTLNWNYLSSTEEKINTLVDNLLTQEQKSYSDIAVDTELNARLCEAVSGELIARLRANNVTGIFFVLNGAGVPGKQDSYAGVYIRDTDPVTDAADNSDLHMLRGLPPLSRALHLSLDSFWQAGFLLTGGEENPDNRYYYAPFLSAHEGVTKEHRYDGYWSLPFQINGVDDGAAITYSEALCNSKGRAYGVLGVEISESYLAALLGKGEFSGTNQGSYYLGVTEDGGHSYRKVTTGGIKYKQFFREEDQTLTPSEVQTNGRIRLLGTRDGEAIRGTALPLNLYPANTLFASQQWTLIGLEDETSLYAFTNLVIQLCVGAAVLAAALGIVVSTLAGRGVVAPIIRLADGLQQSDPNARLQLPDTGVDEIDRLAGAFISLNHDVLEAANRLSRVLQLAGLPVGVFEIRDDSDLAYCSDDVFTLLDREALRPPNNLMPKQECNAMVDQAMREKEDAEVYCIHTAQGMRYLRIRRMRDTRLTVGTILDVTAEVEDRRRIERERDYDLLTGILNRRAFESQAEELFAVKTEELGVAAMLMLDLDNLKYLNDTYGHDCGDGYIRSFAEALKRFGPDRSLIARRSGDEFYVLLYGATDQESLRERIRQGWEGILNSAYPLPDETSYRMRVSAGVAWYPADTRDLAQLIHYADFAMYQVKRSSKGTLEEFNLQDYREDAILLNGRDALDRMIDNQMVRFAAQPILSARTGEVFGYELLMRSVVRELPDPLTVLRLARAQGKLQHIEHLTWFKGLEAAQLLAGNLTASQEIRFFLNSIGTQGLSQDEETLLETRFGTLLPRVVVEVTEGDRSDLMRTEQKLAFFRRHGGMVAIDDYGAGYNGEVALVLMTADIIKLDIAFVHGVDTDSDKQALIRNLVVYARERGIAVLAEGVETREEMRTLIRVGVDYLQGYYLGRPQYQPMNVDHLLKQEICHMAEQIGEEGDR